MSSQQEHTTRTRLTRHAAWLFAVALLCTPSSAQAELPSTDRSLSPYFDVRGDSLDAASLPLKSTRADVKISGVVANVRVTQTYENTGDSTLEAVYVFPASTRAAVFGMKMTIGDRTIVAEIHATAEARAKYEAAKKAGKSATLLEQKRPNVFQMNVANLMPGDVIKVEMDYVELLLPTDGWYRFVYPAVVGPRYTGEVDEASTRGEEGRSHVFSFWSAQPYLPPSANAPYGWDANVAIDAGMPLGDVVSTSHAVTTEFADNRETATVKLKPAADNAKKDLVLTYKLTATGVASGLVLYDPALDGGSADDEKFFLAMMQPPERVEPALTPKREYIFILDVSGSMRGFPLEAAGETLRGLLRGMDETDRFNVMFFSGASQVLFPESAPVTSDTIAKAEAMLAQTRGSGGTNLQAALSQALAMPTPDDYSRTFVVVTDGFVAVEDAVFLTIRENIWRANLFAFGIGMSVNRHLIEGMARAGLGEPFIVSGKEDARAEAKRFETYLKAPVLTDVRIKYRRFDAYDQLPKRQPDVFASRPVVMIGKYNNASGILRLKGDNGTESYERELDVANYQARAGGNRALKYLWARRKVEALEDLLVLKRSDERAAEIKEIGLRYGLMTSQTSFVAVDSKVRNAAGSTQTVRQPVPLPVGVGSTAVTQQRGGFGLKKLAAGNVQRLSRPLKPRQPKAGKGAEDAAPSKDADRTIQVEVLTVVARAPIDHKRLRSSVYRLQADLAACVNDHAGPGGPKPGTLSIELVFSKDGTVTSARLLNEAIGARAAECMLALLKKVTVTRDMPTTGTANIQLKVSL